MVQVEIFNSEYSLNSWLKDHQEYCIRDIKAFYSEHSHTHKFMVIYEDNTREITAEVWENIKTAQMQPQSHYSTTSLEKTYNDYDSIYLNG